MQENERHTQSEKHTPLEPHAHRGRKVWKICLIVLAAVILIPVALLFALYLYLTPARLGEIASTQLSKRLRAEVTVKAIDYRLFSTFPRLYLDADSILIRSRALSAPYDSIERRSPLLRLSSAAIAADVRSLFAGNFHLYSVKLGNLDANLFAVNDSTANYFILPPHTLDIHNMPRVSVDSILISPLTAFSYKDILSRTSAFIDLESLGLRKHGDKYRLDLQAKTSLYAAGERVLESTPIALDGLLDINAKPLALQTEDFRVAIADFPLLISADIKEREKTFDIRRLECLLSIDNPLEVVRNLPEKIRPDLSAVAGLSVKTSLYLKAALAETWATDNPTPPDIDLDFRLSPGTAGYNTSGLQPIICVNSVSADFSEIKGNCYLVTASPENSTVRLNPFAIKGEGIALDLKPSIEGPVANPDLGLLLDMKADLKRVARLLPLTPSTVVGGNLALRAHLVADSAAKTLKNISIDRLPDLLKGMVSLSLRNFVYDSDSLQASGNTELSANADTLLIKSLFARAYHTSGEISGRVTGLRPYLLGKPGNHPLNIKGNVRIDTLDVDRLAYDYYMANGGIPKRQTPLPPEPSDSMAVRVPDFIHASVDISSPHAFYYNVPISDFSTTVSMAPGRARLGNLKFSASFTDVGLDIAYDSRRLDSLAYAASVDIERLNIERFLSYTPALERLAPPLGLFRGALSVSGTLGGTFFPDMAIDADAFHADADIDTYGLSVSQTPEIRKYTRWMLIKPDGLTLDDTRLQARISDNLVRFAPATLRLPAYTLQFVGINNFDGDLYYHAALLHDPLHIPFSINLEGSFAHIKPRLGGVKFNRKKALQIASQIQEQHNFNFPNAVRNFLSDFLRLAAESYPAR